VVEEGSWFVWIGVMDESTVTQTGRLPPYISGDITTLQWMIPIMMAASWVSKQKRARLSGKHFTPDRDKPFGGSSTSIRQKSWII
jgi:hypothetical protein